MFAAGVGRASCQLAVFSLLGGWDHTHTPSHLCLIHTPACSGTLRVTARYRVQGRPAVCAGMFSVSSPSSPSFGPVPGSPFPAVPAGLLSFWGSLLFQLQDPLQPRHCHAPATQQWTGLQDDTGPGAGWQPHQPPLQGLSYSGPFLSNCHVLNPWETGGSCQPGTPVTSWWPRVAGEWQGLSGQWDTWHWCRQTQTVLG